MDGESYFRYLLALIFVVGLILAAGWGIKRFGMGLTVAPRLRGQQKRLMVTEIAALDARRRLVLVRRDETEHLILLGVTHETVLESGIVPPQKEMPT
ncbi:MAG: flagellar biosynthetic protein FliO [Alphaproteobacteria bacterium]|nr:flagellar biosynthetic protein FliO [Alphaproteobacteria bacterium]